jgi:hypothetical protein
MVSGGAWPQAKRPLRLPGQESRPPPEEYVGRIDARKGIATAIQALARLPRAATLTITGDGDGAHLGELRDLAAGLGLGERVFVGARPRAALRDAGRRAGLPDRVARAVGDRPARGDGGRPAGAGHGHRRLERVPARRRERAAARPRRRGALADAVTRLAADEPLRDRLRAAGRRTTGHYTQERWNRGLTAVIRPRRERRRPPRPAGARDRVPAVPAGDRIELAAQVADVAWYHTLELAPGVIMPGWFDLRPVVPKVLPASLAGLRCLDVATFDDFWAFELERRGAREVVAVDVLDPRDWDWPVGSPPAVIAAILRSVCSDRLVLVESVDPLLSLLHPRRPLAALDGRDRPWWWTPNVAGLRRLVASAGFRIDGPVRRARLAAALRRRETRRDALGALVGDAHAALRARVRG